MEYISEALKSIDLVAGVAQCLDLAARILRDEPQSGSGNDGPVEGCGKLTVLIKKLEVPKELQKYGSEPERLAALATECKSFSENILGHLEGLKTGELRELIEELDNLREKLETHLEDVVGTEGGALTSGFSNAPDDQFEPIREEAKRIKEELASVSTFSPRVQGHLDKLVELSSHAREHAVKQRTLSFLRSPALESRLYLVGDAHGETCEWVFGERGNSFTQWLASGQGVFHVRGGLGSGKSTLMRFVYEDPRTTSELEKWAGDRNLMVSEFFFGGPGQPTEGCTHKPMTSLMSNILLKFLHKSPPDLTLKLFAERWQREAPLEVNSFMEEDEIRTAFSRLLKIQQSDEAQCICIFIDGLDECPEMLGEDSSKIVNLVCGWARSAPHSIKVCVSSREYDVFVDGFSGSQNIRLQDRAESDIESYVRDQLGEISPDDPRERLAATIAQRSGGIFVWADVVTRFIRPRLEDEKDISRIQQEIESLPQAWEDLVAYLLIHRPRPKQEREATWRTLAMFTRLEDFVSNLTLATYYFFDQYQNDLEFAVKSAFEEIDKSEEGMAHRRETAQKKLLQSCSGLAVSGDTTCREPIRFPHPSVRELLKRADIKAEMDHHLRGFSVEDAISQLFLAAVKCAEFSSDTSYEKLTDIEAHDYHNILTMRREANLDEPPYTYLHELHSVLAKRGLPEWPSSDTDSILFPQKTGWKAICVGDADGLDNTFEVIFPSLLSAHLGYADYVCWKIQNDPGFTDTEFKCGVLMSVIILNDTTNPDTDPRIRGMGPARELLKQGLAPGAVLHSCNAVTNLSADAGEMTFWQGFIYGVLQSAHRTPLGYIGEIIELFLEKGADPRIWFDEPTREARAGCGDWLNVRLTSANEVKMQVHSVPPGLFEFFTSKPGVVSLKELIEFWDFQNKDVISQLIHRNITRTGEKE